MIYATLCGLAAYILCYLSSNNIYKLTGSDIKELKELFIVKLILKTYTPSLLIVVKIDILDFILSIYLIQKYLDGWHLVIYYSYKMILLELNYNIYNKELLGIVTVLKK